VSWDTDLALDRALGDGCYECARCLAVASPRPRDLCATCMAEVAVMVDALEHAEPRDRDLDDAGEALCWPR
jgi:hypothetical protein